MSTTPACPRYLCKLFLAAGLALLLGACGDSDKNKTDTPPAPETSASPPVEDIPPVPELPVENATPQAEQSNLQTVQNEVPETVPATTTEVAATETVTPESAATTPATQTVTGTAETAPAANGLEVYKTYCQTCHVSGLNGALKYGDKMRWAKVIAQGKETVYQHALEGIRNMPPKGGFPNLTDAEVKAAVDYMVNGSGGWKS